MQGMTLILYTTFRLTEFMSLFTSYQQRFHQSLAIDIIARAFPTTSLLEQYVVCEFDRANPGHMAHRRLDTVICHYDKKMISLKEKQKSLRPIAALSEMKTVGVE